MEGNKQNPVNAGVQHVRSLATMYTNLQSSQGCIVVTLKHLNRFHAFCSTSFFFLIFLEGGGDPSFFARRLPRSAVTQD